MERGLRDGGREVRSGLTTNKHEGTYTHMHTHTCEHSHLPTHIQAGQIGWLLWRSVYIVKQVKEGERSKRKQEREPS